MIRWAIQHPIQTLLGAWIFFYGMMLLHELGHILAALCSGGQIVAVELTPWTLSRTDVSPNPHPIFVAVSGGIAGVVLPLCLWGLFRRDLWGVFAGFCCLANGLYLGLGTYGHVGDCGELMIHGFPREALWVFGIVASGVGIWIWDSIDRKWNQNKEK